MAIVKAPNKNFTGTTASTPFAQGVAHDVQNPHILQWFERAGYEVIYDGDEGVEDEEVDGIDEETSVIDGTDGSVDDGEGTTSKSKTKRPRKPTTKKSK